MRAFHYLVGNNLGVSACTRPAPQLPGGGRVLADGVQPCVGEGAEGRVGRADVAGLQGGTGPVGYLPYQTIS